MLAPSRGVRATKSFLQPKVVAKSAGTMVMSLAQSPGKINRALMPFLELDINVSMCTGTLEIRKNWPVE